MKMFWYVVAAVILGAGGIYAYKMIKKEPLYFGLAVHGTAAEKNLQEQTTQIGMRPGVVEFYWQWLNLKEAQNPYAFQFPSESFLAIAKIEALACITWEPFYFEAGQKVNVLAEDVLAGHYDAYIDHFADALKELKYPVLLRFAHEMNLKQYYWGEASVSQFNEKSAGKYVNLYRYVHDRFMQKDVKNVLWVFCPNADDVPNEPWNRLAVYYPGDDYVNILGIDGYNWGGSIPHTNTRSFKETFANAYAALKKMNSEKPIIIFETASVGTLDQKQQWLEQAIIISREWGILALIWFNVNKENDWRINLTPALQKQFTETPTALQWARNQIQL